MNGPVSRGRPNYDNIRGELFLGAANKQTIHKTQTLLNEYPAVFRYVAYSCIYSAPFVIHLSTRVLPACNLACSITWCPIVLNLPNRALALKEEQKGKGGPPPCANQHVQPGVG